MSNTAHGSRMRLQQLRTALLSLLAVAVVVAWAIVIAVAVHVSTIVLNTLSVIVDLAAMS